ncbi:hypothetical protein HYS99_00265 [Candidatus Giovannonibacteria bacterium]|nr:hypothetical protein [Candidatus Giovannonibacteria bacterium]
MKFKEHKFMLVNALAIAFLVFFPNIILPFLAGGDYRGINSGNFESDEWQYLAHGREILDGHSLGNFILKEGKDGPNVQQIYVEQLLMFPYKLFGATDVNVEAVFNIWGFIGVFLLSVIIYFLALELTADKIVSVLAPVFIIGGYNLIVRYPILFSGYGTDFNVYARPIRPLFSAIFLFLFLYFFNKCLKETNKKYIYLSGATLGALFYVYFYAWTYAGAVIFVSLLLNAVLRDFGQIKKIVLVGVTALAVGAYPLIKLFSVINSELGRRLLFFSGETLSGSFVFSKIALVPVFLLIPYFYKNRMQKNSILLFSLFLGNWFVLNQHIITGREIQPWHYFWYFVIPVSIFVVLIIAADLLKSFKYKNILFCSIILLIYGYMGIHQYRGTFATFEIKKYLQRYGAAIDYLNKDSTPGVILASQYLDQLLFIVHTPHDLFWADGAQTLNTPEEKIYDVFYVYTYLNKDARNNFFDYYSKVKTAEKNFTDRNYYYMLLGTVAGFNAHKTGKSELEVKKELEAKYSDISKNKNNIVEILRKYGVNYIVWDKEKNPEWDLKFITGLEEVLRSESLYLYKIKY